MKKEDLLKLGLTEEQSKQVAAEFEKTVSKAEYDEVVKEKEKLQVDVTERDTQLETLKTSVKNIEDLTTQITTLQEEHKKKDEEHTKTVTEMKIENAIDLAITNSRGKNPKSIKALLDYANIKIEDGKVTGIDKQMKELIKGADSSFLFEDGKAQMKGTTPGAGSGVKDTSKADFDRMSYKERLELYNKDQAQYNALMGIDNTQTSSGTNE